MTARFGDAIPRRLVIRRALAICGACILSLGFAAHAGAQGGVLVRGVVDVEAWKTDASSTLLSRNQGEPAGLVRARLWAATEPWRGLFVFASGRTEGGSASRFDAGGTTAEVEQAGVRYARHRSAVVDLGRMVHPLGAFGSRVVSTRNPLIGIPDAYLPVYPIGAMVSGERGMLDYRIAAVTLPPTHRDYVPSPDARLRPVVGAGLTPVQGFRFAVTGTAGAYLNGDIAESELNGRAWQSYHQRVLSTDVAYGRGHFDLRAELAVADFEVPSRGRIAGEAGYVEARATLTPRVFVAARGEFNRYPFIRPTTGADWISRLTELRAMEVGAGYRLGSNTILKVTVSADRWVVTPENAGFVRPGGAALAVQLSREFDVMALVERRR